ncbi:MAG: glycoside hydrolase family 97 protein [Planctomycetes bacterium]|nr:glycoside hydrolase family 97 protein [Planctomycetota bacterium]
MSVPKFFKISLLLLLVGSCSSLQAGKFMEHFNKHQQIITSPDGANKVGFSQYGGKLYYSFAHKENVIIGQSQLGLEVKGDSTLADGFSTGKVNTRSSDSTWEQPWGEQRTIRDAYKEMRIELKQKKGNKHTLYLTFRAYDDGIAFRYEYPTQKGLESFEIINEITQFNMFGGYKAWHLPALKDNRYEYLYTKMPLEKMPLHEGNAHTPLTMTRNSSNLHISIHEAALTDFSSMTLKRLKAGLLKADLVPWSDGSKVKVSSTRVTPWRVVMTGSSAAALTESTIILNLNEPNRIEDTSWLKPGKYIGIWWGMHLERFTWGSGEKHGATTARTKEYLDFAAENGFDGVLVEGWNKGWDGEWYKNGESFDFTKTYADFGMKALSAHAKRKGTAIIGHHETAAAIKNYEDQMEDAFAYYEANGIKTVKTGYVNYGQNIIRYAEDGTVLGKEWHHGQYMVNHYRKVVETAARHHVMIVAHEPIKDTGIRRTYPNMMSREGARGQEYNAWSDDGGNPPDHTTIIPFTRCLSAPFDFTPGIFDIQFDGPKPKNRINTTLAKQLALYVTIYSPQQMAADLPENYQGVPAFEFIKKVSVDWEKSVALAGAIGDYYAVARKDRNSSDWFIGAITDEKARNIKVSLDFLEEGSYNATLYRDAPGTNWLKNPTQVKIENQVMTKGEILNLNLPAGGGTAIHLSPIK